MGAVGNKAGDVTLNATNAIALSQTSEITNQVNDNATGDAGDINVTAGALFMTDGSLMFANTFGQGNAGNIKIQVGGDITLTDAAALGSVNYGKGNVGNVRIIASGNISFDGGVEDYVSGVFTTVGETGIGNGGDIYIQSNSLYLTNGGELVAGVFQGGQGNSGNITVNVKNSINVSGVSTSGGFSSGLFSDPEDNSKGQGGEILLRADTLKISDGGTLGTRTRNAFRGGHITIKVNNLELSSGGQILTAAFDKGNAGNITINVTKGINNSGSDPTFDARLAQFGRPLVDPVNSLSGLFANTDVNSTGNGGAIFIESPKLQQFSGN